MSFPNPVKIAFTLVFSIMTGILLFRSLIKRTLEVKKLDSMIVPIKYFLLKTVMPFNTPSLVPLFNNKDLR